jgi:broad specificity phosphatase PhoE
MSRRPTTLYLVRHGESEWNAAGLVQGQAADAGGLTARGETQARRAAQALAGTHAEIVITSDLTRAVATAEPIAAALGVEPELDPRLRERAFGRLEGLPAVGGAGIGVRGGVVVDPDARPAGGESLRELCGRAAQVIEDLVRRAPSAAVLVTHGGFVRAAHVVLSGAQLEGASWGEVPNASVFEVRLDAGRLRGRHW